MSIRSKIQALITAANTKTGESDTTLTDAVQTLVDGYGQGGGAPYEKLVAVNNKTLTSLPAIQGLTIIRAYMFYECSSLQEIDCSNITFLGTYALFKVGAKKLFFPNYLTSLGAYTCRNMPNLETAIFAKGVFRFDTGLFESCPKLTHIDLGTRYGYTDINAGAFYNTLALQALILRPEKVITLSAAFPSSSALASTAYIYVPSAYLSNYKTATNWSTAADRILPIEGSIYETQYADGTPIPTE